MKALVVFCAVVAASAALNMDSFVERVQQKIPNNQWVAKRVFNSIDHFKTRIQSLEHGLPHQVNSSRPMGKAADLTGYDPPESFDNRDVHSHCKTVGKIYDQGLCYSSWAVSSASMFSDRLCMHGLTHKEISAENIMECCDDPKCDGCHSGWATLAYYFWYDNGVVTGGSYGDKDTCIPYPYKPCNHFSDEGPYEPCGTPTDTKECTKACSNPDYKLRYDDDKYYGGLTYAISPTELGIQQDLQENGPLVGYFMVYEDFSTYSSGIYQHVEGEELGFHHAKILGWGVENGVKYWALANSWNENWGEQGTFRMVRGTDECGIESSLTTGANPYEPEE